MKNSISYLAINLVFFLSFIIPGQGQSKSETNQNSDKYQSQIEENTKKLLTEFLVNENMEELGSMLNDSIKFHWPNKSILDKEALMGACTDLVKKHDNQIEIIDLMVDGNEAFVLFIWSGVVKNDDNPALMGKEFSIHDCYRLTWEKGKLIEWYTIWGSMDYLMQLGYNITPPKKD